MRELREFQGWNGLPTSARGEHRVIETQDRTASVLGIADEVVETKRMTGGQALVASLIANGVDTLFALPGVQLDGAFDALYESQNQIRVIHPRHEHLSAMSDNPEAALARRIEVARQSGVPEAPLPSDAPWTRMRAPFLDELHAPATVRAGASLALRRAQALLALRE